MQLYFAVGCCLLGSVLAHTKLKISKSSPPYPVCLLYAFPYAESNKASITTVPLGDSITEVTCWRTTLWEDLIDAEVADDVQFVGSMTNNYLNCECDQPWDMHHEGHSGILAIHVAEYDLVGWLRATKPDIVMFMLGTNDVAREKPTDEILAAYSKMVRQMRASNPKMKIIVSNLFSPQ